MTSHSANGFSEIDQVLRLAFGRPVPVRLLPAEASQPERSLLYALEGPGVPPRVSLRRYPHWDAQRAFRAFTVMRALEAQQFPVAKPYYLGWSHHAGDVLLLTEQPDGEGPQQDQPQRFFARVGESFAFTLAHLHHLPWERFPDVPTTPFHYALSEMVRLVRGLGGNPLQDILDWLLARAARIEELPQTLVHGEYALTHVLAHRTSIVAVQGWENAVVADPRYDVGYASAILGAHSLMLSKVFVDYYQEAAGPLPDLVFWEVFSALRLLARVRRTLAQIGGERQEPFLINIGPVWNGLLAFVESRTGMLL